MRDGQFSDRIQETASQPGGILQVIIQAIHMKHESLRQSHSTGDIHRPRSQALLLAASMELWDQPDRLFLDQEAGSFGGADFVSGNGGQVKPPVAEGKGQLAAGLHDVTMDQGLWCRPSDDRHQTGEVIDSPRLVADGNQADQAGRIGLERAFERILVELT